MTDSTVSNKRGTGIENGGTLTITNSTVSGNRGNGLAGGIHNAGTLMLTNSTVSGNSGEAGGGILNVGTLTVTNSTISGNSADDGGGGIFNAGGLDEGGVLTMTNSTVSGNTGGGIAPEGITTLTNTLVNDDCIEGGRGITSNGYNIESPGDTCGFDQTGDQSGITEAQLNLGQLANNGGLTMTHMPGDGGLGEGSFAIDQIPGDACDLTEDQRGQPRPSVLDPRCDVGSVEVQPIPAEGCIQSGGTVSTALCCQATESFPNTCTTGACGCAPDASHEVYVCICPANTCFDGESCVLDRP